MNFLENYINFVAALGVNITRKEWWYTSLSSKNRFQSSLMADYELFKEGKQSLEKPIVPGFRFIFFAIIAMGIKSLYAWIVTMPQKRKLLSQGQARTVLMTFSFPGSYSGANFKDTYWGPLPEFLRKEVPVLQIVSPVGAFFQSIRCAEIHPDVLPIYSFISPWIYLKNLSRLFVMPWRWKVDKDLPLSDKIEHMLKLESCNDSFFYALLVEDVFKSLVKKQLVSKVIVPYEGNAWERAVVIGVKEADPKIKITAYVHTVVPEISASIFVGQNEYQNGPFPDEILTLGEIPTKLLNERGHYPEGVVKTSCALRFTNLLKLKAYGPTSEKRLLVVLEGVFQVVKIVDYFLIQATHNPDWEFLLRFHPALPWEKIKNVSQFKGEFPLNVSFSKGEPLFEEIKQSAAVAYWGSTAGIEALFLGRPILHIELGSILSYDSLFMHDGYHWRVPIQCELSAVLQKIDSLSEDKKNELSLESRNFLHQYFTEVTDERLKLFF